MYKGLLDHINNRADQNNLKPGKVVILPSSFHGSDRAMQQRYQDAMTIVCKYGKPDLFITFTCIPKWTEIQENLFAGQQAVDRPDIVARVFNLKLEELLDDIKRNQIFGEIVAYVVVIEFQKRGLPHAHMLLNLANNDKIRDEDLANQVVCAEIPSIENNPRLHEIVRTTMIHGPCGVLNPNSPCMEGENCKKNFPKDFCNGTSLNVDGYPTYQRRNSESTATVRQHIVDNRWVVPYNPFLLLKYNAHLNVEICSSIKSVKYLYKYVYKGYDCASVQLKQPVGVLVDGEARLDWDELTTYLDARYVSAPEAAWRLFEMSMHSQSHSIYRLAVHLEDQQSVVFAPGAEVEAIRVAGANGTTLTAWFQLNANNVDARQWLYHEIPLHYVYDKSVSPYVWKPRQRGADNILARMYSVSSSDSERFYLRLLLLHVCGATSFDDLRTVNGVLCNTSREVARMLNLLQDDDEWHRAMQEAVVLRMPRELRFMFASLCVFSQPQALLELWNSFKESLAEDFTRKFGNQERAENCALASVSIYLASHGITCESLDLPQPLPMNEDEFQVHVGRQHVQNRNAEESERLLQTLNQPQRLVVDTILAAVDSGEEIPKCFFLDGPGGTGKTYVYSTLIYILRARNLTVLPVAWTGIAATLLDEGRTVHFVRELHFVYTPGQL